jgi:hypothetical protein
MTPNQTKIMSVLANGPYPIHLLAHLFPYKGRTTAMSVKSAETSCWWLKKKGLIEKFNEPNDVRAGVVYYQKKG